MELDVQEVMSRLREVSGTITGNLMLDIAMKDVMIANLQKQLAEAGATIDRMAQEMSK